MSMTGKLTETKSISRPKAIKKDARTGSKTAPLETDFNFDAEIKQDITTYNYFIYYNSFNPRNPSLPKPQFTQIPDLDDIKANEKEKESLHEDDIDNTEVKASIRNVLKDEDKIDVMLNHWDIKNSSDIIKDNAEESRDKEGGNAGSVDNDTYDSSAFKVNCQGQAPNPSQYPVPNNFPPFNIVMPNGTDFNYNQNPIFNMNMMCMPQFYDPYLLQINMNMMYNNMNRMHQRYSNPTAKFGTYNNNGGTNNQYSQQINKHFQYNEASTFEDVYANLPDICKNHIGSRIFQRVYESGTEEQKEKIIDKLIPEVYILTKDVFGNYVIQRLLECVSILKRKTIISQLEGKIKELTLHMYGCRVIQKALEIADMEDVCRHWKEWEGDWIKCIQDQNGNHVIQKLIEKLPKGEHTAIVDIIKGRVYQLSIHQYGCRVIQRIFEFCNEEAKAAVWSEVYECINEWCLDQFGNYVIQNVVEKIKNNQPIFNGIKGKVYEYSMHKFASNVIEKCLSLGLRSLTEKIVQEIIEQDNKTNDVLLSLVKDKFGNYVVQKMIEISDMKNKEILVKRIVNSQVWRKRDGFSKHVIAMIEKLGWSGLLDSTIKRQLESGNGGDNRSNDYYYQKKKK